MSSTLSDVQKILVSLSEPEVVVEPGNVAQLVVTMTNQQDGPDRLLLDVEGVDVEWYAIPVSAVNVDAGAQASERIVFKLARSSENRAGTYPFLVRVQAMETGATGVAQATLVVKPFSSLQLELNPRRAVSTFFSPLNDFDVTVSNYGNDEETLDLYAEDPESGCAYEFDMDRITLKPGQSQAVPLAVRPKVRTMLGSVRLYGFTVTSRAADDSYVFATAHGQVERHALISPLLGIFLLLLTFGTAGYIAFRPTPPQPVKIQKYDSTATRVNAGQKVTLSWDVSPNFKQIILFRRKKGDLTDGVIADVPQAAVGSIDVEPEPPLTTYTLEVRGAANTKQDFVEVTVNPPPKLPPPAIKSFTADPPVIHEGETVALRWQASGQAELRLDPPPPPNEKIDRFSLSTRVAPMKDMTYTLQAISADGKQVAMKQVSVRVVPKDQPIAEIDRFAGPSGTVYVGDTINLRWKTRYAVSAQIDRAPGASIGSIKPGSGSVEVPILEDTEVTFTLTATDSAGLTTTKSLTISPKHRPIVTPDETQPGEENSSPSGNSIQNATSPP